jgi:hypothetical protein
MRPLLTAVLVLLPALAAAQAPSAGSSAGTQPVLQGRMSDPAPQAVQPPGPAPTDVIPPAPTDHPTPPDQAAVTSEQPAATGQWVYTNQYGWVWMPYGSAFTNVPANGDVPNMYLYYPTVGWCWVVAPWVWGWGPVPYFGVYGTGRFGWYGVGFGHWYGFAGPYAGWGGRGYWNGGRWFGRGGASFGPRGGGFAGGGAGRGGGFASPHGGGGGGGHGGGGHR